MLAGQTRDVMVYTLLTAGTIEERVADLATQKLRLEKMVVGGEGSEEAGPARPAQDPFFRVSLCARPSFHSLTPQFNPGSLYREG